MLHNVIPKFLGLLVFVFIIQIAKAGTPETINTDCTESSSDMCNTIPYLSCPPFVWLKPTESTHPNRTGEPVAEPGAIGCDDPIVTYRDEREVINLCHIVITRIWRATDPNNGSLFDTCHQTIKQVDEEAPVIENVPDDITIFANRSLCRSMVQWDFLEIYDNVLLDFVEITGERLGQTFPVNNGQLFDEGVTMVTYRAVDICTNFTEKSFTVTVLCADCHLICPDDVCLPLGSDISPAAIGTAEAYSGNVDCGIADIDYNDIMVESNCNGAMVTSRIWSASFSEMPGISYNCMQRIELKNDSDILLSNCPPDVVVANNFTPVNWEEPQASNGANTVTLTSDYTPGGFFPVGLTTVTYTATDGCGNEVSCSFKVSVLEDITHPDCPDDIIMSCDGNGGAVIDWDPPVYNGTCPTCPDGRQIPGFVYVGSLNGSHYYCSRYNYTFQQAQENAARLGGHIVSINSQEENHYVATHIGSRTAMIGLSDISQEGNFVWESGEPLDYNNWFSNQPNDKDNKQDVVEIDRNGEWNDVDNDSALEFVLEIPCTYVTQIGGPTPGSYVDVGDYTITYVIADGCGYVAYCEFQVIVEQGIWIDCIEDITVRIPSTESEVAVTFDLPSGMSCCELCPDQQGCVTVEQIEGPVSGSMFPINSTTSIKYRASDPCGNFWVCEFDIDIKQRAGSRLGSQDLSDLLMDSIDRGGDKEIEIEEAPTEHKVYPNPVSNLLNVQLTQYRDIVSMSIISPEGKKLIEIKNFGYTNQIAMTDLPVGVHLLVIQYSSGKIKYEKIIKI